MTQQNSSTIEQRTSAALDPVAHNVTRLCNTYQNPPALDGEEDRAPVGQRNVVTGFFPAEQPQDAIMVLQSRIESAARRILAGGACPDCGQSTVCSVCGSCHYCNDIDLPCGRASVRRRHQAAVHTVTSYGNDIEPLVHPMYEEAIAPSYNPYYQATQAARQLTPFVIIARQCGQLVLTRWGDIYQAPPFFHLLNQQDDDQDTSVSIRRSPSRPQRPSNAAVAQPQAQESKEAVLW